MQKRENSNNTPNANPLNPGLITQVLKTPERLWMTVLLIDRYQKSPTIEEFARDSDLSLGFISKFANILRDAGFMAKGRTLNLLEPGRLLDIIRDLYFFEANQIIPYYSKNTPEEILKTIKKSKKDYALTRMCGSSLVAPFVRYQLTDFYIPDQNDIDYWKDKIKLVDVEISGNVSIIVPQNPRIFSRLQTLKGYNVVNNIQLYLDLYKYPSRGREQAEHLREKVIKI